MGYNLLLNGVFLGVTIYMGVAPSTFQVVYLDRENSALKLFSTRVAEPGSRDVVGC